PGLPGRRGRPDRGRRGARPGPSAAPAGAGDRAGTGHRGGGADPGHARRARALTWGDGAARRPGHPAAAPGPGTSLTRMTTRPTHAVAALSISTGFGTSHRVRAAVCSWRRRSVTSAPAGPR